MHQIGWKIMPKNMELKVTNYDDMAAIVNWNTKGGRVSEKPTLTKDEPTPILEKGKIALSDDDVNSAVIDTLLIEKQI